MKVLELELKDYIEFELEDVVSESEVRINNPKNTWVWWRGPRYEYVVLELKRYRWVRDWPTSPFEPSAKDLDADGFYRPCPYARCKVAPNWRNKCK